ncbi:LysR family transcriptional regulator [Kineococcus rhizosphaerae]|uniref:DNA-binding transcriptional LysR family regulator n=1 Tax=Kineococcus rhizosphaerae TaxID=559628 RepID=A0A2T0R687_9ACTN|nr:LysR family transcriptional regulator [Kineococcus rhizosphaerae]PRY16658.1 DNA-binding transcriptional LysR family regulator [Kineococcus rhizosphaerae]
MDLRALEHFVAVVDEGGFTRAAQRLLVAQPGVSAQIRNLERELGQTLFERHARGATLTAAGEAALPHARAALAAAAAVGDSVAELSGLLRGTLRLGMLLSSNGMQMPALLRRFRDQAPAVDVTIVEDDAANLLAAVREGTLDVAWTATAATAPEGLQSRRVSDEPLSALVVPGHRWTRRRTVPLAELCTEPLLVVPRGGGIRTVLDTACAEHGLDLRVELEANSPVLLAALAREGLGIAVVPSSYAATAEGLHALRIVRPDLVGRVQVVWRAENPSPATRAFAALVRRAGW